MHQWNNQNLVSEKLLASNPSPSSHRLKLNVTAWNKHEDISICCHLGTDDWDFWSCSCRTNNTFHFSNTMVWFRSPVYEGVWWAYVSIVPQTMKPSISLSVLPGGGRTHSITGFTSCIGCAHRHTHTPACAKCKHMFLRISKSKNEDNRDRTENLLGICRV